MKAFMLPMIKRESREKKKTLPSIFTVDSLGLSIDYDNSDGGLLNLLYSLIDYQILTSLGSHINYRTIREKVPYSLTLNFLRRGVPQDRTIHKLIYDDVYNEITYPIFLQNYSDPHIPNNYRTRAVIEQHSRDYASSESDILFRHTIEALVFLQTAGLTALIDSDKYLDTINEKPLISRTEAILLCLTSGYLPAQKRPLLDMNGLVNNVKGYIDKTSEFESIVYANANSIYKTGQRVYTTKEWIWSGKKRTRHRGMDGVTVPVNDPFIVTNERTGETCELMYPRDYARDPSGANTVNCGCEVFYSDNMELRL